MSFFETMSRDNRSASNPQPSRLRQGPGSAPCMLLDICQMPGYLPTQGRIIRELVLPALVYVRQREAPTRPLGHVGADPPGVDILSKIRIRAGAGGVAYVPGPGLPGTVCQVLNNIRTLWAGSPALEKTEFANHLGYERTCYYNN